MRYLLTFVLGALVGAAGLFAWLRQLPRDEPQPAPAAASQALPGPATSAQVALQAPPPPPPQVEPDLSEANLPLAPDPAAQAALAQVPDVAPARPQGLMVPVEGVKASQVSDTFGQPRGKERRHEALDIMAPRGTRVLAAADGKVVKLFNSKPGGLTVYEFDPTRTYAYYYAHLDRYADGLKEGMELKRGDLVGYVGSTGNARAEAPHLHFAVVELTPEKEWWKGTAIDPYPMLER
jgi:murein DD-endopeptidase MepM/ murein hydrolase activator NlpD